MEEHSRVNPLWWACIAAVAALLSDVYKISHDFSASPSTIIRVVAFSIFLALYLSKSRWAWHVLAIIIVVLTPITVILIPIDPGLKYHHPRIIWLHITLFVLGVILILKSRKQYFAFVADKPTAEKRF